MVDGFAENVLVQYKSKFPNISEEILLVMAASVFARLSCEYMFGTNENRAVLFAEIGKLLIREAYIRYPDSQFPQWKTLTHVWSMLLSNRRPPVVNNDPNLEGLENFCTEVISSDICGHIGDQHKYMPPAWSISTAVYPSLFIPAGGHDVTYDVDESYRYLNPNFWHFPNYDAVEPAGNGIADNEIEVSDDGSEISDDGSEVSDDGSEISSDESEISDDESEISNEITDNEVGNNDNNT